MKLWFIFLLLVSGFGFAEVPGSAAEAPGSEIPVDQERERLLEIGRKATAELDALALEARKAKLRVEIASSEAQMARAGATGGSSNEGGMVAPVAGLPKVLAVSNGIAMLLPAGDVLPGNQGVGAGATPPQDQKRVVRATVGTTVAGWRVQEVSRNGVLLSSDRGRFFVSVGGGVEAL